LVSEGGVEGVGDDMIARKREEGRGGRRKSKETLDMRREEKTLLRTTKVSQLKGAWGEKGREIR
jgi:hypothetical protein